MIAAKTLKFEFDRRMHRVRSEYSGDLSVQQIDSYLNEGLYTWFENRVSLAKVNSSVRNDLRQFEKKKVVLEFESSGADCSFFRYPQDFYKLLRQRTVASKGSCKPRVLITHIISNDDLEEALKNPNWKPSFEWEETLADDGGEGLWVYHDNEFTIDFLEIDYYKKPSKICNGSSAKGGSYIDETGTVIDKDCNLEVDSTFAWRKIVDLAVLSAERDLSDFPEYESQRSKILFEQVFEKSGPGAGGPQ